MPRLQYKLFNNKIYSLKNSKPDNKAVLILNLDNFPNDLVQTVNDPGLLSIHININKAVADKANQELLADFVSAAPTLVDKTIHPLYDSYLMFIDYVIMDNQSVIKESGEKCIKMGYSNSISLKEASTTNYLNYVSQKLISGIGSIQSPPRGLQTELVTWTLFITKIQILAPETADSVGYSELIDSSQDNTTFNINSLIMESLKEGKLTIYDSATDGRSIPPIPFNPDDVNEFKIHINLIMKEIFEVATEDTITAALTTQTP